MKALYLEDSYLKEWYSVVSKVQNKYVVLNQSAFYPTGGGQPNDTGVMIRQGDGLKLKVLFVGKFSGDISHELDKEGLQVGDKVKCKLDWDRRYRLMRTHTAAHIISQVFHKETNALITGGQLGMEDSRIDLSTQGVNKEMLPRFEEKINEVIQQNHEVSHEFMDRKKVEENPSFTKLAKGLPPEVKTLRILRIGDFDEQVDGGTHVKTTKEIGRVKLVDFVNKGKDNKRVYFVIEE